jgi:phage shock protein E
VNIGNSDLNKENINKMVDRSSQWITPIELHAQMQDSAIRPLVIDLRGGTEYQAGHISDAVHVEADELLESLPQVGTGQPLVLYCDMHHPGSSRSERAADQLRQNGLQARILEGGFPAWEAADYPVDRGRQFHQVGKV